MIYITLYLLAIILANLSVARFGPASTILNAFLFIGLDLSARDRLHEMWKRNLIRNMGILIAAGSVLSYLLNRNAGQIAIALFVAFGAAAIADTIIYHLLGDRVYLVKVNGSNLVGAAVDSLIFPTLAFGGLMPIVTLGQFIAKVAGGFVWAILLRKGK